MKLMDMVKSYASQPRLKGRLLVEITLDDGTVYPKGTVSNLLVQKTEGTYHFEADHSACTVSVDEIEIL